MDCSPPGSSVHEILRACILVRVAMPSSRGSVWPMLWTCIAGRFFTHWAMWEALFISCYCCCSFAEFCLTPFLPHGLQHTRLSCPSPSPRVCSNSCPSSRWCHPSISSSATLFSTCLQSFPASGSFLVSQLLTSGSKSIGASVSILSMNIKGWFTLGLTGSISLVSKGLFKSLLQYHSVKASVLQCSAFFMVQLTYTHDYWKNHSFDNMDLCPQGDISAF